jgi:hypothetical protein
LGSICFGHESALQKSLQGGGNVYQMNWRFL